MAMRSVLFIIIISAINLSCSDDRKDLFLEYARLSCFIKSKLAQRDSISQILSVTNAHLTSAKTEANRKADNYVYEINSLDNKIYQVKSEYEQKYNELSQKHEARHGHMMTPEYEQDINNLENWKVNKLKPLEERVTMLNRQMEEDSDLKNLKKKIISLEELSRNQHELLRSCEKEVNDTRKQIQAIDVEMDKELKQKSDKAKFMEQRKKVELNPCK